MDMWESMFCLGRVRDGVEKTKPQPTIINNANYFPMTRMKKVYGGCTEKNESRVKQNKSFNQTNRTNQ